MNNIRTFAWRVAATVRLLLLITLIPAGAVLAIGIVAGRWCLGYPPEDSEDDEPFDETLEVG